MICPNCKAPMRRRSAVYKASGNYEYFDCPIEECGTRISHKNGQRQWIRKKPSCANIKPR